MNIDTVKKNVKLHFKENELVAVTVPNGTRKMYQLTEMTETENDNFWECDKVTHESANNSIKK